MPNHLVESPALMPRGGLFRTATLMFCALAWLWAAPSRVQAQAQEQAPAWPSKPVKIIVAGSPGSPPEVLARGLGQRLQEKTGQAFIIDNRPGANTIIAMQACATAVPDGSTFCLTTNDSLSVNPHLYNKLPYDPDKSFAPVAMLAWPHGVIVANAQLGVKTFQDVVALSKAKPGTLNWASFGVGSSSHLYLEWIRDRTGWDVTHVPYNAGRAVPATLSGEAQLTYLTIGGLKQHLDAGKLVALAVAGTERSPFLPQVPTFAEVGLGDFFIRTWFGLFAPAGTPAEAVAKMHQLAMNIVNDASFKTQTMDPLTLAPAQASIEQMQAYLKKDRETGAAVVKIAKVKLD